MMRHPSENDKGLIINRLSCTAEERLSLYGIGSMESDKMLYFFAEPSELTGFQPGSLLKVVVSADEVSHNIAIHCSLWPRNPFNVKAKLISQHNGCCKDIEIILPSLYVDGFDEVYTYRRLTSTTYWRLSIIQKFENAEIRLNFSSETKSQEFLTVIDRKKLQ